MTMHPIDQIDHLDDYPYEDMNGYERWGMCQWEYILYVIYSYIYKRGEIGQYSNPPRVFKKILKLVLNPFIKIEPHPIRGEARRVPEKTSLIPRKKK